LNAAEAKAKAKHKEEAPLSECKGGAGGAPHKGKPNASPKLKAQFEVLVVCVKANRCKEGV
jgi:hypothetical protein